VTRNFTLLLVLLLAVSISSFGQVIDPQIYVETPSATCAGTAPCGGDPNIIDPSSIDVGFAGNHSAVAPLLMIVGVPDGGAAPTISLPGGVSAAAAGMYYGLKVDTSGNLTGVLEGVMTSAGGNAYSISGLKTGSGGGSSESYVNWNTFDSSQSIGTGGSFNLYAYAIDFALNNSGPPAGNSPINIDFTGTTAGSFVIAYNCATSGSTCTGGDIGETPFTNAGATTGATTGPTISPTTSPIVPEPNSIVLLGSALLGVSVLLRRKFIHS